MKKELVPKAPEEISLIDSSAIKDPEWRKFYEDLDLKQRTSPHGQVSYYANRGQHGYGPVELDIVNFAPIAFYITQDEKGEDHIHAVPLPDNLLPLVEKDRDQHLGLPKGSWHYKT